jgi:hypothetical protein
MWPTLKEEALPTPQNFSGFSKKWCYPEGVIPIKAKGKVDKVPLFGAFSYFSDFHPVTPSDNFA